MTANDTRTREATYLEVISAKTATLFAAAAADRRAGRGSPGGRGRGAAQLWREHRHRVPAGRRHPRLQRAARWCSARAWRRFPGRQDHSASGPRLCARQRRGAPLLAAHPRAGRAARGRSGARDRAAGAPRRACRQLGRARRVCRCGARRARALSRRHRQRPRCWIWSTSASSAPIEAPRTRVGRAARDGLPKAPEPLYHATSGRSVAQPGRAPSSGGGGRVFESPHSDQPSHARLAFRSSKSHSLRSMSPALQQPMM